jgi:uncharacterized radical SAM superfamily Fe-S cluster-containing enzyme
MSTVSTLNSENRSAVLDPCRLPLMTRSLCPECLDVLPACIHQDAYNHQIERVRRCVVQYAGLDGRLYPFCTYNCGPCHRNRVEKQFAVPVEQYRATSGQNRRAAKARTELEAGAPLIE